MNLNKKQKNRNEKINVKNNIIIFSFLLVLISLFSMSVVYGVTAPVVEHLDGTWSCGDPGSSSWFSYLNLVSDNGPQKNRADLICNYQCTGLDRATIFKTPILDNIDGVKISKECCQYPKICIINRVCVELPKEYSSCEEYAGGATGAVSQISDCTLPSGEILKNVNTEAECESAKIYCNQPNMRLAREGADFVCCHESKIYASNTKCCEEPNVLLDGSICCPSTKLYASNTKCCEEPNVLLDGSICCPSGSKLGTDNTCCSSGDLREVCKDFTITNDCQCDDVASLDNTYECTLRTYRTSDTSSTEIENLRITKTGYFDDSGKPTLTQIDGVSCNPPNKPITENIDAECKCLPSEVSVIDNAPIKSSISCSLYDLDSGDKIDGSTEDLSLSNPISKSQTNTDKFRLGDIILDGISYSCYINLNVHSSECYCKPVYEGDFTTCTVTVDGKTIWTKRISTSGLPVKGPNKATPIETEEGSCEVIIQPKITNGNCIPDGYNGECPDFCRSFEDPDCDYGRSGLLFTNFLFNLAGLPAPQEWWNSVLQAEGFQKFFDVLDNVFLTPEWFTARICSDDFGLDAQTLFEGDTADNFDGNTDTSWIPPADFLDTESGVTFAVEYDGRNYYISWIFSQFLENKSVFRIDMKSDYNGLISTNPEQVYPFPKNGNWYWEDRNFVERLVSNWPFADSKYYWAPIQNGVGNTQVNNVPTEYDTACLYVEGQIFKNGEYETIKKEFCRNIMQT